jgi:hypothetical protein
MADIRTRRSLVLGTEDLENAKGKFGVRIRIDTSGMTRSDRGLPVATEHEDVELWFGPEYPDEPPTALVGHDRFAGRPHVLLGRILCIYLDPAREWHPALGVDGAVDRLIQWLQDAVAGRFDSRSALYHPVGGLPPSPRVGGTLVVRQPPEKPHRPIERATLNVRTASRCDIVHWGTPTDHKGVLITEALVLAVPSPMPFGVVQCATLGDLCARVEQSGGAALATVIAAVARLIVRLPDEVLRIIVDVAHPDDASISYIACAMAPMPRHIADMVSEDDLLSLPISWMTVSDERPAVAQRRDATRPAAAFLGRSVEIWGCGGLGSWVAEFIARAGASRMVLRDTGGVSGGLLVRQNYLESDVGSNKAEALARRIDLVSDGIDVDPAGESVVDVLRDGWKPTSDVVVDATVNATVAARLDEWARSVDHSPLLVSVATDPRTATLGLLLVASPGSGIGPATVDDATWARVAAQPKLERYNGFWQSPHSTDQLIPGLGCSTPTFHGAAADVASLAGSFVSLLGSHLGAQLSGAHLIEAAHARGPGEHGHVFIEHQEPKRQGASGKDGTS